ncbi:hypothetical protein J2S49_000974 [Arcanobacterium wilhelmae]|uniref:Secreted protein n=1 Tax=Arcanobacterium wilhelmae TaxID=1803177 RepID=A0ABT9NBK7_9ACTO|nr:DUF6049 family protein [Arcanobacterium wilhelmae]MDP9800898.1 hypothetical protein [Arcanobacterium wilhelmae]WFN90264.1 DUF6049 family protein [Arcanobacterium wilhelmae]
MKRALRALAAASLAFAGLAGAAFCAPAQASPTTSGSPAVSAIRFALGATRAPASAIHAQKSTEPQLTITSVGAPVLSADTPLRVTVSVSNPGTEPITLQRLDLRAAYSSPLTDQHIRDWMDGNLDSALVTRDSTPLTVAPGASTQRTIVVPAQDLTWDTSQFGWGPRGILVRAYTQNGVLLSDTSFIIVAPKVNLDRTPTTVVAPLTRSSQNITQQGTLTEFLAQAQPVRLAQEPQPTPSTSSSAHASTAPLVPAPKTPAGQASEPGDLAAQVSTFVKEPENTAQITQILADAPTTGVEFLADPTLNFSEQIAPALQARTYRYLPAFDASIPAAGAAGIAKATKLANESVTFDLSDTQSLNLAKAGGYNENIVSSNAFYPNAALTYTPAAYTPAHTSGLPTDVFRYDQSLADALAGVLPGTTATGTRDSAGTLSALDSRQLALTVAAMQYRERPNDQRGIIAAFERGTTLDLATAKALLDAPWAKPASLEEQKTTPSTGEYAARNTRPGADVVAKAALDSLNQARKHLASIAKATPFSADVTEITDLYTSLSLAQSATGIPSVATHQIAGMDIAADPHLAVKVAETSTINMISEASSIPLRVVNSLPFPISASVVLRMPDQRLRADSPAPEIVGANNAATFSIPVKAYGSGDLSVEAQVQTPTGAELGTPTELDIRVRAQWENVGTIVFGTVVVLLFAIGVVKSVKKGRRSAPVSANEFGENVKRSSHQISD